MIEHFDPVQMTLPEIEAMQAKLAELAAMHRREEDGKPEDDPTTDFVDLRTKDWAPVGDCMDIDGFGDPVEELEPFDAEEEDWRSLEGE